MILCLFLTCVPPAPAATDVTPPAATGVPATAPATAPPISPDARKVPGLVTRPSQGAGANPDIAARAAVRSAAEAELLASLVPRPLTEEELRATTRTLGTGSNSQSAVDALVQSYEAATKDAYAEALRSIRSRMSAGYRIAIESGKFEAVPGPELVALLTASAAWRITLAAADDDCLQRAAHMRTDEALLPPGLARFKRAVERDDVPASDPTAALRLPDLIEKSGLTGAERLRVETALEKQWISMAAAIATRRQTLATIAIERARLGAEWGASWEISAAPATLTERNAMLARLSEQEVATEAPLRKANGEAAVALLRLLSVDAAESVREATDRTMWPWLFDAQQALDAAIQQATDLAGAPLGDPLSALARQLQGRLKSMHRELSKRAAKVAQLQAEIQHSDTDPTTAQWVALLEADKNLQEFVNKRQRVLRDAAVQMQQAASYDPKARALFDEQISAIDAQTRASQWRIRGFEERLNQLKQDQPATESEP